MNSSRKNSNLAIKGNGIIPAAPFIEAAEKANLAKVPRIQKWIRAVAVSNNRKLAEPLAKYLHVKMAKALLEKYPFAIPQEAELDSWRGQGIPLPFGIVHNSELPFFYTLNWLMQHGFCGGSPGTGKTNFLSLIALEAMKFISVWIFDRDKQDYRHLLRLNQNLRVFDVQQNFIWNPLQVPPYVKPEHHLTSFATNFCKSQNLLDGSENMATRALYRLYEERGIFQAHDAFPTLYDLRDKIRSYNLKGSYRALGYQDSLLNRLDAFLMACPETYAYSRGYPIEELAKMSFVLEVKGLGERHGRFFVNSLALALFHHRIGKGERGGLPKNLLIWDECKWMTPPGMNESIGYTPFATMISQAREASIGCLLADQGLEIESSIFVQSRAKFIFRLGSGDDIERAQRTLALSKEQADFIHKLDTGQCICRIPRVDPFVIQVPKIRLE